MEVFDKFWVGGDRGGKKRAPHFLSYLNFLKILTESPVLYYLFLTMCKFGPLLLAFVKLSYLQLKLLDGREKPIITITE